MVLVICWGGYFAVFCRHPKQNRKQPKEKIRTEKEKAAKGKEAQKKEKTGKASGPFVDVFFFPSHIHKQNNQVRSKDFPGDNSSLLRCFVCGYEKESFLPPTTTAPPKNRCSGGSASLSARLLRGPRKQLETFTLQ